MLILNHNFRDGKLKGMWKANLEKNMQCYKLIQTILTSICVIAIRLS